MVDHLPRMNSGFKLQNQKKETVWRRKSWRNRGRPAGGETKDGENTESPRIGSCYGWSPPRHMLNVVVLRGGVSQ